MGKGDVVRVGRARVPLSLVREWVAAYTDVDKNQSGASGYAFPAYDRFDGGPGGPATLTDGDLLAPTLLNVKVKIRSFYGLEAIRPTLEKALSDEALATPLAEQTEDEVRRTVPALYAVLDGEHRPWGIQGTKLSKVMHRKRPASVVLHDRWVYACYVGGGAPVPRAPRRTWAQYMTLLTLAVRAELRDQAEVLDSIAQVAPEDITRVRLLDIIAWHAQGRDLVGAAA